MVGRTAAGFLTTGTLSSVYRQVLLDLPVVHLHQVLAPLLVLRSDEMLERMLAQRGPHERALTQQVQRLAQVARQLLDAVAATVAHRQSPDVLVHRFRRLHPVTDTIQPRGELYRQREVRIRG